MKASATAVRAALILAAALLAVSACGSGPAADTGSVITILVPWGGKQLLAFTSIVRSYEAGKGITVHIEPTRSLTQELAVDEQDNDLPDVAVLPSIAAISQYVPRLKRLDQLIPSADYGPPWRSLMRPGSGQHVYAVPIKADVKSLIWFDPAVLRPHPTTLRQLVQLSARLQDEGQPPWCLALSVAAASGYPGTDWVADILLSQSGPAAYQRWVDGTLPWTSDQVRQAWKLWGQLMANGRAIQGGGAAKALARPLGAMYPSPGGCLLAHGALVEQGFPRKLPDRKPAPEPGFFTFPSVSSSPASPLQVSGDFIGMFHGTSAARKLVRYLASANGQQSMVNSQRIDGLSADNKIQPRNYPDLVRRRLAGLLTSGQHELCFGASDAMPPTLSADFDQAALEYLSQPGDLWQILRIMSAQQATAFEHRAAHQKLLKVCASPAEQRP